MQELRKVNYEDIIWQLTQSVSNTIDTLRHSTGCEVVQSPSQ